MDNLINIDAGTILDSLGDGVYVTDPDRQILYWNKTAERITGWSSADMVGRFCFDEILSHVDKDGHPLCGKEYCPLHRSIVTGIGSECPLVFALGKDGRRVPVQVSVAPSEIPRGWSLAAWKSFVIFRVLFGIWKKPGRSNPFPCSMIFPKMTAFALPPITFPTTS